MSSPPMLADRTERRAAPAPRRDPATGFAAAVLGAITLLLLADGIAAVYTYNTPTFEGPMVAVTAALFGVVLLVLIGAATLRKIRRGLP